MNFKNKFVLFIYTNLTCLERTSPDLSNGNQLTSRRNKKSRSIKNNGKGNLDEDEDFSLFYDTDAVAKSATECQKKFPNNFVSIFFIDHRSFSGRPTGGVGENLNIVS